MNESPEITLKPDERLPKATGIIPKLIALTRQGYKAVLEDMERSPGFYVWVSFLIALIFLAGYALLMSLVFDMEIFEFSLSVPWGMMVSNYVFLVGSSVGLCMVASLGSVFGLKRYKLIGKRGVFLALISIALGLSSIGLHLGHPERGAIYNALTPNVFSAMWYMGTLYPPYIAFVAIWYWLLARRDMVQTAAGSEGLKAKIYRLLALEGMFAYIRRRWPLETWETKLNRVLPLKRIGLSFGAENADSIWAGVFGALALTLGLVAYTVEGSLFAHTEARAFWYGALYPIDFFLGASFCGLSWIMAMGLITYKLKGERLSDDYQALVFEMAQILALLLSVGCVFTAYKMGHGLFEPEKARTIILFLKGPFSVAFWAFEVAIGLVLPIGILLYSAWRKKTAGVLIASIMVLVGYFVKRYDFVVASQIYPVNKQGLPSYLPTFLEVMVIGGILGAFLLVYTLGVRFLPLKEDGPQNAS